MKRAVTWLPILCALACNSKTNKLHVGECFRIQDPGSIEFKDFKILEVRGHSYVYRGFEYHPTPPPGWYAPWVAREWHTGSGDFAFVESWLLSERQPDCDHYEDDVRNYPDNR